MATTDQQPPLIEAGSRLFAGIAAVALLVGSVAGMTNDTSGSSGMGLAGSHREDAHGTDGHAAGGDGDSGHAAVDHGDEGHGSEDHGDAGHDEAAAPAGRAPHHDADHGAGAAGASHGEVHLAAGPGGAAHHGGENGDAGHAETGHGGSDHGDGAHDAGASGAHADHGAGCADDHPATVALATEVRTALDSTYKDMAALAALGYHPYFDSLTPGGWPPGGEGISHWLNPNYIDDGTVMDPRQPEAILLDEWNRPLGMMFINDAGVVPVPVYVNDDGTVCSPWHPHTDLPARFGWYYYRAMYDREVEGTVPEQTPEMMHVWAVANPAGVYSAHEYPPKENRQGPPGPLPSYLSEGILAETLGRVFASVRF